MQPLRIAALALAVCSAACGLYFIDHNDESNALGNAGFDGGIIAPPDGGPDNDGGACNGHCGAPDAGVIAPPDSGVIAPPDAWPANDGGGYNEPPDAGG